VEEHFYLLLPPVVWLASRFADFRRSCTGVIVLIAGGAFLRYEIWEAVLSPYFTLPGHPGASSAFFEYIYYPTYCRLDGLILGVAVAAVYRLRPALWKRLDRYANLFLVLGALGLALAYRLTTEQYSLAASVAAYPLLATSFTALLLAALLPGGWLSRVRVPGVETCATLAFTFYLTHKQVIRASREWLLAAGVAETSLLYPLLILAACGLASLLLHRIVERPFLRLRDRSSAVFDSPVRSHEANLLTVPVKRR
jgi:peptidoglycan/LPS O-acetylase OafA/YrhL